MYVYAKVKPCDSLVKSLPEYQGGQLIWLWSRQISQSHVFLPATLIHGMVIKLNSAVADATIGH